MDETRSRRRPRLTYANVVATVALFAALGGGAYATHAHRVGTQDLRNGAVTTTKLDRRAVAAGKLKPRSVGTSRLKPRAVAPGRIRRNAVGPAKIRDGAIRTASLAPATRGVALAGASISRTGQVRSWFNRLGGRPTVEMPFEGRFELEFPGVEEALTERGLSSTHLAVPSGATVDPHQVKVRTLSGTPGLVDITTWDHEDEDEHLGFQYLMLAAAEG